MPRYKIVDKRKLKRYLLYLALIVIGAFIIVMCLPAVENEPNNIVFVYVNFTFCVGLGCFFPEQDVIELNRLRHHYRLTPYGPLLQILFDCGYLDNLKCLDVSVRWIAALAIFTLLTSVLYVFMPLLIVLFVRITQILLLVQIVLVIWSRVELNYWIRKYRRRDDEEDGWYY